MNYVDIIKNNKEAFVSNFYPNKLGRWSEVIYTYDDSKEPKIHEIDIYNIMKRVENRDYESMGFPDLAPVFHETVKRLMSVSNKLNVANFGALLGAWTAPYLFYESLDNIDVYELRPTNIEHPKINVIYKDMTMEPLDKIRPKYDVISCIDSISHAGLGRYSSLVSPNADINMGKRVCGLLRPGGYLIIAITCVLNESDGGIIFNIQRNYTKHRISLLTEGLELIECLTEDSKLKVLRSDIPSVRRMFLFRKSKQ
jgi:hypothetical protein